MGKKIKTQMPDENGNIVEVEGTLMDIKSSKEPWAEYILSDGVTIQVKQAIIEIVKTNKKDQFGNWIYAIKGQPIVNVIHPVK